MKKTILSAMLALGINTQAMAQYQFPNSDFEDDFVTSYVSESYTEPLGWHGYATLSGGLASSGRSGEKLCASDETYDTSKSGQCAYIKSTSIFGVVANGVMTNGQIYASRITATDGTGNYNFSDGTNTGSADTYGENNEFFTTFTGRPDSVKVWLRFVPASSGTGDARMSIYTHKTGTVMYDPTDNVSDMSIVVAHAETSIAANDEWVQYTVPFDYSSDVNPGLILATFTTNETPGGGTKGDILYIDDIEMVYNYALASATYSGEEIAFSGTSGKVDALYASKYLKYTFTGAGAYTEVISEPTATNGYVLTFKVVAQDNAQHYNTYMITFSGLVGNEGDDSNVTITVPELTAATLTSGGTYYMYNVGQGGYLSSDNSLTATPQNTWTITGTSTGYIQNNNGTYLAVDRNSYLSSSSSSFDATNFPVTSNSENYYTYNITQTDDYIEVYRKGLKLYDNWGTKRYANVFAGASSMSALTSYATTISSSDSGKETSYTSYATSNSLTDGANTQWRLYDPTEYMRYMLCSAAATASLTNGESVSLLGVSSASSSVSVSDLPLGIYAIDGGDKFYLESETNLTLTAGASTLTYYGLLDLTSRKVTYDGETVAEDKVDALYDASKLAVVSTGNGAEDITLLYDEDTAELTIIISGYGRQVSSTVQFALPDVSLTATYNGTELTDGRSINEEYDAAKLTVSTNSLNSATYAYDEATAQLTITFTSATQTATYTIQFALPEEEVVTPEEEEDEDDDEEDEEPETEEPETEPETEEPTVTPDTTAIVSIADLTEADAIYTLAGQRLSKPTRGHLIENGKKV